MLCVCSSVYAMEESKKYSFTDVVMSVKEVLGEMKKSHEPYIAALTEHRYTQKALSKSVELINAVAVSEKTNQMVTKSILFSTGLVMYTYFLCWVLKSPTSEVVSQHGTHCEQSVHELSENKMVTVNVYGTPH